MKRTGAGGLIQIIILMYPPTLYFMRRRGAAVNFCRFFGVFFDIFADFFV